MKFSEFRTREKQSVQEFLVNPSQDSLHDIQDPIVLNKLNNILGQLTGRGVMNPSALLSSLQNFLSIYGLSFSTTDTLFNWFSGMDREYSFELRQFGGKLGVINHSVRQQLGLDGVTRTEIPQTDTWMRQTPITPFDKHWLHLTVSQDSKTRLYYFTAKIQ